MFSQKNVYKITIFITKIAVEEINKWVNKYWKNIEKCESIKQVLRESQQNEINEKTISNCYLSTHIQLQIFEKCENKHFNDIRTRWKDYRVNTLPIWVCKFWRILTP